VVIASEQATPSLWAIRRAMRKATLRGGWPMRSTKLAAQDGIVDIAQRIGGPDHRKRVGFQHPVDKDLAALAPVHPVASLRWVSPIRSSISSNSRIAGRG
jgi:hypothetical protein